MKPNWDDAPEWAKWLAKDASEVWYWHEYRPTASYDEWVSSGLIEMAEETHWSESLEERP